MRADRAFLALALLLANPTVERALAADQSTMPKAERPEAGAKPEGPHQPRNLVPIAADQALGVLGKRVHEPTGDDLGVIVDALVDAEGKPIAAVIDFGGFLGVGSRKIAVDWRLLQFRPGDSKEPIVLSVLRDEVQAAPEYKPTAGSAQIVGPPEPVGSSAPPDAGK